MVPSSVGGMCILLSPVSAYSVEYKRLKKLLPRSREEECLSAAQTINIVEWLAFEEAREDDNNEEEE